MDNDVSSSHLSFTHYPFGLWLFGLVWFAFGMSIVLDKNFSWTRDLFAGLLLFSVAALLWLIAPILTIHADKITRILTITTWRPVFGTRIQETPFDEIADCQLESHQDRGEGHTTYRIVIIKKSGEIVPFTPEFSSGHDDKAADVSRLVEFLGLPGSTTNPSPMATRLQNKPVTLGKSGNTYGINWQFDHRQIGNLTVVRWICLDFHSPGNYFLMVSQRPPKASTWLNRLVFDLGRQATQHAMEIYGFSREDLPGLEHDAALFSCPQLDANFICLSNAPDQAAQLLNAGILQALLAWTQKHPARELDSSDILGQISLLFSPRGTYLIAFGDPNPIELNDMITVGGNIVRQAQPAPHLQGTFQGW